MKKIIKILQISFVIMNLISNILFPILIFTNSSGYFPDFLFYILPMLVIQFLIWVGWAAEAIVLAIVFHIIALLPAIGCCLIKKQIWIYRMFVYIPLIANFILIFNSNGAVINTFIYLAWAIAIDILNKKSRDFLD